MLSPEFVLFLNDKALDYLPADKVKIGSKYNFRCPFCGDSHKSLTKRRGWFYTTDASYYCFNCGTHMSGIKFLEAVTGDEYTKIKDEYLRMYLRHGNMSLSSYAISQNADEDLPKYDFKSILDSRLKKPLTDKAKQYLSARMVLDAPFLTEPLYSCYDKLKNEYILIPWTLNGCEGAYYQLNDFLHIKLMKYMFPKGTKKLLYGLDNIDITWPYIIVFEGVYDSLFVKNGIATGTKSITDYLLKIIKNRYPHHLIVVSFDNDKAGMCAMSKLIRMNKSFKYFKWFDKRTLQKDINDRVKALGDANAFSDLAVLEKMIVSPLMMKLYMTENGVWNLHEA